MAELTLLVLLFLSISAAEARLATSEEQSLLKLQQLLQDPSPLSNWSKQTDFCSSPTSWQLNISCTVSATSSSSSSLIVLQIVGDKSAKSDSRLSNAFSMDDLGNILSTFPNLQTLSLVSLGLFGNLPGKLDHLKSLTTLNLSSNYITGGISEHLANSLSSKLEALALDNNELSGTLPSSFARFVNLKVLSLSHNRFKGNVPVFPTLQQLNLGANRLGPAFPSGIFTSPSLQIVLLGQNKITSKIPSTIRNHTAILRVLDLSYNSLFGSLPPWLFGLSSLESLRINQNKLSGKLPYNLSIGSNLHFIDVSSNIFTGQLPKEFVSNKKNLMIRFQKNCFSSKLQQQYSRSHCTKAAAAASHEKSSKFGSGRDLALVGALVGGALAAAAALAVLIIVLVRCMKQESKATQCSPSSCADTASTGVPSDLLSNARYLSQSIRLGVLGAHPNRVFSLSELEEATANFSNTLLISEGVHGKVFKGRLQDGSAVVVKCIALDEKQDMKLLKSHIELLCKIRHKHLVSYIGHCIHDTSSTLFLISEYIHTSTFRSHLSRINEGKEPLNWPQRLAVAIGAGRGIQYLHTGVVPGIFNNEVNIVNILLDHNYVAKFTDFGLGRNSVPVTTVHSPTFVPVIIDPNRKVASDKNDVFNFGVILLEMMLGKIPTVMEPTKGVHPKFKELEMLTRENNVARVDVIDKAIVGSCIAESLSTVVEIAGKCVSEEEYSRPSMEDILWNLQYAAQVQERVSGEFYGEEMPYVSPPRSRFNRQALRANTTTNGSSSDESSLNKATFGNDFLR